MMHKHPLLSVLIILVLLGLTLPAAAITFGEPDREAHPYVGVALFFDEGSDVVLWSCSGTLLSPTVFLTAGHCTFMTDRSIVLFKSDLTGFEGSSDCDDAEFTCHESSQIFTYPVFQNFNFPNTGDVGIIILAEEYYLGEYPDNYGELPPPGVLDPLATRRGQQDTIIRTVGYGRQMVKPFLQPERIRYTSTSKLVNLRSHLTDGYNIHTSNNPGKGQGTGGSCFGDSGGPIFYPYDTNQVVGVVSFGLNNNCKGADFAYRTDIEDVLDFINYFLDNY